LSFSAIGLPLVGQNLRVIFFRLFASALHTVQDSSKPTAVVRPSERESETTLMLRGVSLYL